MSEGRCRRASACVAAERVDTPGGLITVGAPADRPLCTGCEKATADALRAAPGLYVKLRNLTIDRGATSSMAQRVTSSRPGSFGLNATPLHLSEGLHWHVTTWADEVIATAERPAPDRASQTEGQQTDDALLLLGCYLSTWITHGPVEIQVTRSNADPDDPKAQPTDDTVTVAQEGWEACGWLIDWQHIAERVLKLPLLIHYPPEPCPACNEPNVLKRKDGDDKVSCTLCGKAWTLAMYETFVHAWIGAA